MGELVSSRGSLMRYQRRCLGNTRRHLMTKRKNRRQKWTQNYII